MPIRAADAEWGGDLMTGKGHIKLGSGAFEGNYDWRGRSGDGAGTNPEELLAAAHASCFSMALSMVLSTGGHTPTRIHTIARASFDKVGEGFAITKIELTTEAAVPGISEEAFQAAAETAKVNCPVSKALAATPIHLNATLQAG